MLSPLNSTTVPCAARISSETARVGAHRLEDLAGRERAAALQRLGDRAGHVAARACVHLPLRLAQLELVEADQLVGGLGRDAREQRAILRGVDVARALLPEAHEAGADAARLERDEQRGAHRFQRRGLLGEERLPDGVPATRGRGDHAALGGEEQREALFAREAGRRRRPALAVSAGKLSTARSPKGAASIGPSAKAAIAARVSAREPPQK